jgi:hypothetical protein
MGRCIGWYGCRSRSWCQRRIYSGLGCRESSWHSSWVGGRCWRLLTLVLQLGVMAHVLLQRRSIPPAVVALIFAVVRGRLGRRIVSGIGRGRSGWSMEQSSARALGRLPYCTAALLSDWGRLCRMLIRAPPTTRAGLGAFGGRPVSTASSEQRSRHKAHAQLCGPTAKAAAALLGLQRKPLPKKKQTPQRTSRLLRS